MVDFQPRCFLKKSDNAEQVGKGKIIRGGEEYGLFLILMEASKISSRDRVFLAVSTYPPHESPINLKVSLSHLSNGRFLIFIHPPYEGTFG